MAQTVLVAVDGSPQADVALEHAIEQFQDAELVIVSVVDPVEAAYGDAYVTDTLLEQRRERAKAIVDEAVETAQARGRTVSSETRMGRPSREVLEFAEESGVDHIVVGSHGRTGLTRVLLGSVAESIVRRASVPVTVVR